MILTRTDCISMNHPCFMSKGVLVLKEGAVKEEYRSDKYQIGLGAGFATSPNTIAAARGSPFIFSCAIDGDSFRCGRDEVYGLAKPEVVARWLNEYKDKATDFSADFLERTLETLEAYSKRTEEDIVLEQNKYWRIVMSDEEVETQEEV